MKPFVFVGERRSQRAMALNVTWLDGKLAAKTLHEALRAAGVSPESCIFVNLYFDGDDWVVNGEVLITVRAAQKAGHVVIAMGRRVQRELTRASVPFLALVHPAARGSIRRRESYQAHVRDVLGTAVAG